MQLSFNNQSLLATGCYETNDPGITRMGKEVINEMNRVGMVVDMSHSSERSTLEAMEISKRPIVISHANPSFWHPAKRNKSNDILLKLAETNGFLGFSLYPHHLNNGSVCKLEDFCKMIAKTADLMGIDHIGFGSDLCQDQPDSIVEWMRVGKWTKEIDYGEGSASNPGFPEMPNWFRDNRDWHNILQGLKNIGFNDEEVKKIKGENWLNFFKKSFTPISK
jgi:microsomal dipeptidase-like Zn-dependent dipeptidase